MGVQAGVVAVERKERGSPDKFGGTTIVTLADIPYIQREREKMRDNFYVCGLDIYVVHLDTKMKIRRTGLGLEIQCSILYLYI